MDGSVVRRAKTERNQGAKTATDDLSESVRLELDRQSRTPYYRQIRDRLSDAIVRGVLRPGVRLPSARSLASHLATSRGTIDLAYSLLSDEGYVLRLGAAGTLVASGPHESLDPRPALAPAGHTFTLQPFMMGLPALDAFPRKLWARLSVRHARRWTESIASPLAANGYGPLREAVASYLAVSRGILCSPDRVRITSGFQHGLGMITRALLKAGDQVWLEDPCYFAAREALKVAGARLVGVPVDSEGIDVQAGVDRAPEARFAYVTPAHQAPLGISMTEARRSALLAWATRVQAWIVEDDYDSEFRYGSRPLPALKSLDRSGQVLYVGSFSKVLFPGLRLGYLVVPDSLAERFDQVSRLLYNDRPTLNQAIVADFIAQGHFARHIKRMRKLYAERRMAVSTAMVETFGADIDLQLEAGGMHLLARFPRCTSDTDWVARARNHGLAPDPLSRWRVERDPGQGLLMSFTNIPADRAGTAASRLKQAIGMR
jgi:GntR family transcriptional regulator/MocR family aminotransferase